MFSSPAQPLIAALSFTAKAELEHVPDADDDTTVTTVSIPLAQEARGRHDRIRCSEVACIGRVEEVSADLKPLTLTNVRVLHDAEIDVVETVGAQDVASRIADSLSVYQRLEERVP